MQRRHFLTLSVGVSSIAGCLGDAPNEETETDADDTADGTDDGADENETATEETNFGPEDLPEGFSETGIDDIERVKDHVRTTLTEDSFEFTFEPILTSYTRSIRIQRGNTGELHGTLTNQNPGASYREGLRESELYSPPERDTVYFRINNSDDPAYDEGDRTEFIALLLDILAKDLDYFSYSYLEPDTYEGRDAHIFDITGPADEDQWEEVNFGTGVPYDEFNEGRTVIGENGMALEHSYRASDTDTSETAEPEWHYRTVDEVQISRPDWVDEV
jgi:hypothetical protein